METTTRTLALLAALASACARPCPTFAPASPPPTDAPAAARLDLGAASVDVVVRGPADDPPRPGVPVTLTCACLPAALRLATDRDGLARARGLPAGTYTIDVELAPSLRPRTSVVLAADTRLRIVREPPPPPRRAPADASLLPADVALRYERTACLGPCPAFVAWLDDQGRVRLDLDGRTIAWRLGALARRRALRLARCLALAPTYDVPLRTDFPTASIAVRDRDAVLASTHAHGDPRAPPDLAALEAKLARVLRLPRHTR